MELDKSHLLISKRLKNIASEPFTVFSIEDYLPSDLYLKLLQNFPSKKFFLEKVAGNKLRFGSRTEPAASVFNDFCSKKPLWLKLVNFFKSEIFLDDLYQIMSKDLIKSRGKLSGRSWRTGNIMKKGAFNGILKQRVKTTFEFSKLQRDATVKPHTDKPDKLVSLILYFPDPRWNDSYGGSTEFYRPNSSSLENNWKNRTIAFKEVSSFTEASFKPNKLVGFLKTKNSYHGVQSINCPQEISRHSFQINIITNNAMQRISESIRLYKKKLY